MRVPESLLVCLQNRLLNDNLSFHFSHLSAYRPVVPLTYGSTKNNRIYILTFVTFNYSFVLRSRGYLYSVLEGDYLGCFARYVDFAFYLGMRDIAFADSSNER